MKDKLALISAIGAIVFTFIAITTGPWIVSSYFEAQAFNRLTGKNASTWDAMWVELRVDGGK
jgi:hypothetical protein